MLHLVLLVSLQMLIFFLVQWASPSDGFYGFLCHLLSVSIDFAVQMFPNCNFSD